MESLKSKLGKYHLPVKEEKSNLQSFQEYALDVISRFQVGREFQGIIWRHAKRNKSYLEGKVRNCEEKFGSKLEDKGNYLISLFRKKKPWDT
jgi:hypothetical protein